MMDGQSETVNKEIIKRNQVEIPELQVILGHARTRHK